MDSTPLSGQTVRCSSSSPSSRLASFLLSDLGAALVQVPTGAPAEISDLAAPAAGTHARLSSYGERGRFAGAARHHSAVEAVGGAQQAQYTYEPGPAYLVSSYSTVAAALLTAAATIAGEIVKPNRATCVSDLQGLLAINEGFYVFGPEADPDRFTHTPRGQTPVYSTYLAADDWIFVGASTTTFMIKTLQALGLDEALDDPSIHELGARALRASDLGRQLWERIGPIIRAQPREHWLSLFSQIKVPAGPVLSMEEALAHPQLGVEGLVEPGGPIGRLTRLTQVTRQNEAAPRHKDTRGPLPLSGLRVVELAGYIAGSYTGRLLGDLGADVVKIEPPDGDPFRAGGYGFVAWNRGKRSLALNLRDMAARARLMALTAEADIFVTNYRPEALSRMGVGREELFAVNPGLIHATISAFGERGPLAHLPGFDPVVQAFAGIMKRQGGDDEPVKPQMAATDYLSAMLATVGILAARSDQLRRGGGYVVKTSLLAAALLLNAEAYDDVRARRPYVIGGRDFKGPNARNRAYNARDGWLLTVGAALTPGPSASKGGLIRPNSGRGETDGSLLRYLEGGVGSDSVDAAIARLATLGLPAVPCLDPRAMPADPHFTDNRLFIQVEQPDLGVLTMPASVLGAGSVAAAPACGEHNEQSEIWNGAIPG